MKFIITLLVAAFATTAFAKKNPADVLELSKKNTVTFNQAFTGKYVAQKQNEIFKIAESLKPDEAIYLVMDSPGGSVSAGNSFIDSLKAIPNPIHTVTLFAASMAYHTVQNLGTRYILPSGQLMSHRARISGLGGQIYGELNSRLEYITKIVDRLDVIAAARVGMDVNAYKDLILNEFWITGNAAVRHNHADKVVLARCDESISGSYTETVRTLFGAFDVEFSNCPLIRSPLSIVRAGGDWASQKEIKSVEKVLDDRKYLTNTSIQL
jgi:ATP-dependent Clp protease protease subunit